jgi:hypothetical protein
MTPLDLLAWAGAIAGAAIALALAVSVLWAVAQTMRGKRPSSRTAKVTDIDKAR